MSDSSNITDLAEEFKDLPEDEQKKAGQAIAGDMNDEHKNYLQTIIGLLDRKEIDVLNADSFYKDEYYGLSEDDKSQVGVALLNIVDQVRIIEDFYRSNQTPNESPHLQTMIEQLWQMKEKLEQKYGDVLKI